MNRLNLGKIPLISVSLARLVVVAVLLSACVTGPAPQGRPDAGLTQFVEGVPDAAFNPREFRLDNAGPTGDWVLSSRGRLRPLDGAAPGVSLGLPAPWLLENVSYGRYDGELLILYQAREGDSLGAGVARIALSGAGLRWRTEIPGFNVGEPLAQDGKLYVSALGFVGKIDLNTGRYDWKHEGLYREGVYTAFRKPRRDGADVVFVEVSDTRRGSDALSVRVDDASGALKAVWGRPVGRR